MKKPEQLPLDFSETATGVQAKMGAVSPVISLELVRVRKEQSTLGSVYEAIRDSIKHIDVRRATRDKSFVNSSFGT